MATASGTQDLDVSPAPLDSAREGLREEHPGRFDFFQAVRLLHAVFERREPVGRFANPDARRCAFANNLAGVSRQPDPDSSMGREDRPQMKVNFMGLTGPWASCPHCYTELILDRTRAKDRTLADFFDLFNHRMISLFYQAWEKYRFGVAYERDEQDRFSRYLMA